MKQGGCSVIYTRLLKFTARVIMATYVVMSAVVFLPQESSAFMGNSVKFDSISIGKGTRLSTKPVIKMLQDKRGLLWFVSSEGLSRYDGSNQKTFETKNLLKEKADISTLDMDVEGNFWIGTWQGSIYKFTVNTETLEKINLNGFKIEAIVSLYCSKGDEVWFSTKRILYKFNKKDGSLKSLNVLDKQSEGNIDGVRRIAEDGEGRVYLGTDKGLICYSAKTDEIISYLNVKDAPADVINDIYFDKDGIVWIGSNSGFYRLEKKTDTFKAYYQVFMKQNGLSGDIITAITRDKEGNLLLGTDGNGVDRYELNTENFETYTVDSSDPNSITGNKIRSLYTDDMGNIWVGLDGEVNRISWQKNIFNHTKRLLEKVSTPSNNKINAILEDTAGNVWMGTPLGLDKYDRATGLYNNYKHDPTYNRSLSNNAVTALAEDSDGNVWIGTKNGLNKQVKGSIGFEKYFGGSDSMGLTNSNITALQNVSTGIMVVGTSSGFNLLNYKNNTVTRISAKGYDSKSPSSVNVKRLFVDKDNFVWIGTDNGLNRLDLRTMEYVKYQKDSSKPDSLAYDLVSGITQDSEGKIWVGTSNGKLDRLDASTGKFQHFGSEQGLDCDTICGLLSYGEYIWISSNRGIFRYNIKNLKATRYTRENGLQKNEFNDGAYFKSKNNELFFGGDNGFNNINPVSVRNNQQVSLLAITGIKVSGSEVPLTGELNLSYKQNSLQIDFACMDFSLPENNQYAYMLTGVDKTWNYSGSRNVASYNSLSPGKYEFKFIASNSEGVWNDKGVSLVVNIKPNPFLTWWAYLIYIIFAVSGFAIYFRVNIQIREKEIKRQRILVENLKKLDKMKDEILANTSHELRTPLNGIIGITETLKEGLLGEMSVKAKSNLSLVLGSAKRLLRLVNDILDLAKINRGELSMNMSVINFRTVFDECIGMVSVLAEKKNLKFVDMVDRDEIKVVGDPYRLQQIIINIVGNAIKFTEKGYIEVGTEIKGKMLEVHVKDTGKGIPKEKLSEIFREFVQVDGSNARESGGTGLGLAITRKLVEMMGGQIWVESQMGAGSTFKFSISLFDGAESQQIEANYRLPDQFKEYITEQISMEDVIMTKDEVRAEKYLESEVINDTDKYKLLVVDDEMINRVDLNNRLLAAGNFIIINAENGEEAVALIETEDDIDLVLMDIMMPKMTGIEACRKIREKYSHYEMPILMLTAKDTISDILEAFNAGANDYLTKPYDREVLKARSKNLIGLKKAVRTAIQNAEGFKNEKQKRELTEMLANITRSISQTLNINEVMKMFVKYLKNYFGFQKISVLLSHDISNAFNSHQEIDYVDLFTHYMKLRENDQFNKFLRSIEGSELMPFLSMVDRNGRNKETANWLDFPIVYHDKLLGVVSLETRDGKNLTSENEDIVTAVVNQAGGAIENARLYSQVKILATVDGLTGLFIRRHFFERAEEEIINSHSRGERFVIIMTDIDNFKKVNDTYGHTSGDIVLRKTAEVVRRSIRREDIAGRYGGEEFIVAIGFESRALEIAENLRNNIENELIVIDEKLSLRVTISVGVAVSEPSEREIYEVIKRADLALYKAKRTGKNKVVLYDKEMGSNGNDA